MSVTSGRYYGIILGNIMAELIDACEKGRNHDKDPIQFSLYALDVI